MQNQPELKEYLAQQKATTDVAAALEAIACACIEIQRAINGAPLNGSMGVAGAVNVQDEVQKKLDVITNDILSSRLASCDAVAGFASEELPTFKVTGRRGGVLVTFDPLDGSSNIDVNVSVGTIFSLLAAPAAGTPAEKHFLRPGREQLAAGYAIYGPQTNLVLTVSSGVTVFTLDRNSVWRLTNEALEAPLETAEFAINMSNQRHWASPVAEYIAQCLAGATGPRGKNFNMRWTASMVADVHRILTRGGIFLYPWDAREPDRPGKLRLLYEGNPMAMLIERAGGEATDGVVRLLDLMPTRLHQRVPIVLGSQAEVRYVALLSSGHKGPRPEPITL
jgi:fructose-1,6-bisphosphatase I